MAARDIERVDLNLPSVMDYLSLVNGAVEEIADRLQMDESDRNALATAVVEACTNAIEHGNREDPRKTVRIRFLLSASRIEVLISDQGRGFDLSKVKDPAKPENLLRERGRGIFIIRSFMDEVRFQFEPSGGTTVRLIKNLSQSARAAR